MRYMQNFLAGALAAALSSVVLAQGALGKVDGSSTVYPVTEAVAEEFQKAEKNAIKVTVGIS
ncbi:MAG: protein sphX, partial [Casimicrobiaceae bacterium]